jgi:hypothetical protein
MAILSRFGNMFKNDIAFLKKIGLIFYKRKYPGNQKSKPNEAADTRVARHHEGGAELARRFRSKDR